MGLERMTSQKQKQDECGVQDESEQITNGDEVERHAIQDECGAAVGLLETG
jgi:hypothetical protein